MRRKTFLLLCIAFITLFIGISPLQAGHYYYKQISLKDGLPSTVRGILTMNKALYGLEPAPDWDDMTDMNLKSMSISQTTLIPFLTI